MGLRGGGVDRLTKRGGKDWLLSELRCARDLPLLDTLVGDLLSRSKRLQTADIAGDLPRFDLCAEHDEVLSTTARIHELLDINMLMLAGMGARRTNIQHKVAALTHQLAMETDGANDL